MQKFAKPTGARARFAACILLARLTFRAGPSASLDCTVSHSVTQWQLHTLFWRLSASIFHPYHWSLRKLHRDLLLYSSVAYWTDALQAR